LNRDGGATQASASGDIGTSPTQTMRLARLDTDGHRPLRMADAYLEGS
jgi:hypothetical protein